MGPESAPPPTASSPPASANRCGECRELRILLVEDLPINKVVVEQLLKSHGYQIAHWAANGANALAALRENTFDLVLMDCRMPGMDGFEATRRIRAGEGGAGNARVPIIALTANSDPSTEGRCRAAGMNDCLFKPLSLRAVLMALEKVVAVG